MNYEIVAAVPPLPPRAADGHKGTFGRVLIVAGSSGMIGAAALSGMAALRMGAGLVQVASPASIVPAILTITPELIALPLGASSGRELSEAMAKSQSIMVGPGLGQSPAARQRVMKVIAMDKPMVVDADALNILAAGRAWPASFNGRAVLTPHPGEMGRLAKFLGGGRVPDDETGRIEIAIAAAKKFAQVVVLKGHRTVVTDGRRVFVNQTGDSTLAKAGSGDILSGILATLLAQAMERFDAACAAVHLHGRCGEQAGRARGRRCGLARDVIDAMSGAVAEAEDRPRPD